MTDRIEKSVLLRAPVARVWAAVADSGQFGVWFGVKFEGPFVAGETVRGRIVPTQIDAEVAKLQEPLTGMPFAFEVVEISPMRLISFRWHPYAIEPGRDYSAEPTTLIEFALLEKDGGTQLTITECGFDGIPLERRAKAFAANEGGWSHQLLLIEKYVLVRH